MKKLMHKTLTQHQYNYASDRLYDLRQHFNDLREQLPLYAGDNLKLVCEALLQADIELDKLYDHKEVDK